LGAFGIGSPFSQALITRRCVNRQQAKSRMGINSAMIFFMVFSSTESKNVGLTLFSKQAAMLLLKTIL
jgi:hypothetical protein